MTNKKSTLLVCWFKEHQWDHLKQIVSDSENLGETYADWKKGAEQQISLFRKQQGTVVKMSADSEKMLQWAKENNIELSSANLSQYAFHLFEDKYPTMVVCWYKKEQWDHLKEIVSDPKKLGDTYEEWEKKAEQDINMFRNKGQRVKKIPIDTEQMQQWANQNNLSLDSSNLSDYAEYLFEKDYRPKTQKAKKKKQAKKKKRIKNKYGNNFYNI